MEEWRKSTYSSATGGSCIEVASARTWIGVRDTKQAHLGQGRTVLSFSGQAWAEFLGRMPEIG